MKIKKILWPTDFSSNAQVALPYVKSLSEQYITEVHVLYVIPELGIHEAWYGDFEKSHIKKIHEWEQERAQKRLNEICDNYLQGCPFYINHIAIGDPAEEILKLIKKEPFDMVVMASHGRSGRLPFGSVADAVSKNTPVPVVIIPINREVMAIQ